MQDLSDIHAVLDARAVTTVFQPLVDLTGSGATVAYEALSRGPVGTPWAAPLDLFAAARAAGRAAELDWICRANAYRAALAADLPPEVAVFVNLEPTSWREPCPPDLRGVVAQAQAGLRVVTEMTEHTIADDPAALIAATTAAQAAGWGVAFDDVGARPESLALMPFVRPNIVKLDMQLVRQPGERHTAQVVSAVLAYAERAGATIVAEGIENAEQLLAARAMGAMVGQGWHFGRPGPLPERTPRPVKPLRVAPGDRLGRGEPGDTPYSIVARDRATSRATKALLMPLSRHLEEQAALSAEPPVLLATFQQRQFFTPRTAERFAAMARRSPLVAALAAGLGEQPAPGVRGARLSDDDPLLGEWDVIVVGPHYTAALVAREVEGPGPDHDRQFDFVVTHDHDLVVAAARSLLRCLHPVDVPTGDLLLAR